MRMAVDSVLKTLRNASPSATECIEDIREAVDKTRKVAAENIKKEQEKYYSTVKRTKLGTWYYCINPNRRFHANH
jgi:predicted DNA-binding protein (UPF0278 family)